MGVFGPYLQMLRDGSPPENRVVRKTAVLTVVLVLLLAYYRHVVRSFGFGEPLLVTATLAFSVFCVVGVFGGLLAAHFYRSFRRAVGARSSESSPVVFAAEWLFACAAPLIGLVAFGVASSQRQ